MRKFLINISYTVLPVWLFFVGMAVYLWITNDNSGDLMRLGLINSGPEYTDSICAYRLPSVYYMGQDDDSLLRQDTCDILVIGDSFSHGGGVGKEGDYVNFLAHDSGRKVIVFTPHDPTLSSPIQIAYDILNLGCIDSTHVKNLVVQEVERYLVPRHDGFVTTHTTIPRPERDVNAAPPPKQEASPLLRVKDFLFYHLFGANPIFKVQLTRPVFGGVQPDQLYFYREDVEMGFNVSSKSREKIIDSYQQVIQVAKERGVNVIMLVAGDKYDLYQDYIVDNPYPAKTLNEDLQQWLAPELDHFVFSKQVLLPYVKQGVKDVYLFNDTHWSPASSRLIAGEIIKKLK